MTSLAEKSLGAGDGELTRADLANREIDPFEMTKTLGTQDKVFRGLFCGVDRYQSKVSEENMRKYWDCIRDNYLDVLEPGACKSYHTYTHATDVTLTCHSMLFSGGSLILSEEEQTAMILAAYAHDVLHPGMNNLFYVNTKHDLAIKYDNKAVLERQSIDFCLPLVKELGIFEENSVPWNLVVECINYTDMSQHKDLMEKIDAFHPTFTVALNQARAAKGLPESESGITQADIDAGVSIADSLTTEQRSLFASFMLHCADISNCAKSWEISERWAVLVMNEFWAQGDVEKKLGLPLSMNCDRDTVVTDKCQWGFITFMLDSLFQLFRKFFPELGSWYYTNLKNNQARWKAITDSGESYVNVFKPPTAVGGWKAMVPRP